jgi:tRNA pseudouridine55 synthase
MYNGILLVDKPRGMTSHDVVDAVRCMAGIRQVGHTGTLDPDASGVLVLCLGRATRFARFFEALDKTYWTVMQLGSYTDTQDATGLVVRQCPVPALVRSDLEGVLRQFTGPVQQIPPMYSAVKHQGQRLYHLARQGRTVARQARHIFVQRLELIDVRGAWVTFSVTCSKGTYIRTLCEDIGMTLGCGAHMVSLQRCRVGAFELKDAYALDFIQWRADQGVFGQLLMPLAEALDFLPAITLTARQFDELQKGQGKALQPLLHVVSQPLRQASLYRLCTPQQGTFAVVQRQACTPEKWKLFAFETTGLCTPSN